MEVHYKHGGSREGAGRPTIVEVRKARTFKTTEAEWELIKEKAINAGYTSTSEFIRNIALQYKR